MRSECQGFYHGMIRLQVAIHDFEAFVSTFYKRYTQMALASMQLRIDLAPHDNFRGYDILPVIQLRQEYPELNITFTRNAFFQEPALGTNSIQTWERILGNDNALFREHVIQGHFSALWIAACTGPDVTEDKGNTIFRIVMKRCHQTDEWLNFCYRWPLYLGSWDWSAKELEAWSCLLRRRGLELEPNKKKELSEKQMVKITDRSGFSSDTLL